MNVGQPGKEPRLLSWTAVSATIFRTMIELNPVRARIADLSGRLDALRGYL